jgi:hypothetical protein
MKKSAMLLALLLVAGGTMFARTRVFVGFGVGPGYYAPPAVAYVPPCPGPGYTWVAGYWYRSGPHRYWRRGYWAPPRHHYRDHYYRRGFRGHDRDFRFNDRGRGRDWDRYRGRDHDRRWDRDRGRDFHRGYDRDRGRGRR